MSEQAKIEAYNERFEEPQWQTIFREELNKMDAVDILRLYRHLCANSLSTETKNRTYWKLETIEAILKPLLISNEQMDRECQETIDFIKNM
jgi:hypothetical protein